MCHAKLNCTKIRENFLKCNPPGGGGGAMAATLSAHVRWRPTEKAEFAHSLIKQFLLPGETRLWTLKTRCLNKDIRVDSGPIRPINWYKANVHDNYVDKAHWSDSFRKRYSHWRNWLQFVSIFHFTAVAVKSQKYLAKDLAEASSSLKII